VPGQTGPDIEEDEMYPTMMTALGAERIREWHEQADRDRLVIVSRRARREALRQGRLGSSWWARRATAAVAAQRVPADATPDQWASALSVPAADERADAAGRHPAGRQPVGGRTA
jgi:hypothetical protein